MGTLSLFTIDVYTVTIERDLMERRREAQEHRLLESLRERRERRPGATTRHRPRGRRRFVGAH